MSAYCRLVARQIPPARPDRSLGAVLDRHVSACLRCQAEAARYRKLQRTLAGLADEVEPAPSGLARSVEAALDVSGRELLSAARLGRVAAATGAVAATAAGVAAVALWRRARHAL